MKLLQLSFLLLLGCGNLFSQKTQTPSWSVENSKSKSFIENLGQFDQSETETTGKIHYVIDLGATKIYFGEKGVCYNFHEVIKKSKEERAQIMSEPIKTFEDHKQKERLAGKFLIKKDQVNMAWNNPNSSLEIQAFEVAVDYHSYTFQNEKNETENINYVKGYKYIIYKNIYPNIDLKYEIHPVIGVKYAFTVHPGADPNQIKMIYDRQVTLREGEVVIPTLFGDIVDHAPISFYEENEAMSIESNYLLANNQVSFDVKNFDPSKTIVIDPWVQTPVFPLDWDCVWELDTDVAGNVYIIGGVDPLQLKKYNSAGVLQWSYDTPYDTTAWMGTMATDDAGNTYVTNGTYYAILKVNTTGGVVWNNGSPSGGGLNTEFWNISFNCDQTKLIVGGTGGFIRGQIYEIDMGNGDIVSSVPVSANSLIAIPPQIQEVRAMCAAPNGKYYFVTLDTIGYLNDNLSLCPGGSTSLFEKNHGVNWGYKAENWRYDNTGIKVIRADANFVYTHKGNALQKRSLVDFSIIATVVIPGGVMTTPFLSDNVTENAGIDIDNCGNIYVGSKTGVYKFNSSLVQQAFYPTTFVVYDVRVSTAGDVVACGGTGNSSSAGSRSGGVQSFAASACVPIAITCCDATVCVPSAMCATGSSVTLTAATAGGTWSGTGVNVSGVFNPAVSGPGIFVITYTLACGSSSISITVNTCASLSVCVETNGTLTASNGVPVYNWQNCTTGPGPCVTGLASTCGFFLVPGPSITTCNTFATGTNIPAPGTWPIQVVDNLGTTATYLNLAAIPACTVVSCPTLTFTTPAQTNVLCNGNSTGSATVLAAGGTGPYTYTWVSGSLNGATQSNLAAGVYTINVVDINLCPGTTTVTITQPAALAAPTASVTAQPTCLITTGTITVTAPTPAAGTTYTVTGTAPVVAAQTNATGIFSGLASGNYSVMATVNGCNTPLSSLTVNAIPTNPAAPTATVTVQPTCIIPTGTITVTVPAPAAGTTYTVTGTAPVVAAQTNATGIFSGLASGNYSVITTVNGCISTATSLTVNAVPANPAAPTASVTAQPTCVLSTGIITVTVPAPAAGTTYTVTGTAPVVAAQTNATGIFSGLAPGTYSVITTVNGCISTATSLTVNAVPANPAAPTASVTAQPTCVLATGTITVTVPAPAAGTTYTVTGTAPVVAAQTNATGIFSGLASGNYTVTTTIGGCTSTTTPLTINAAAGAPAAPTATITQPTCAIATGDVTVLTPTPAAGTTYTLTGIAPVVAAQTNATGIFSGLAAGNYTVITTVGGCNSTTTSLTVNAQPPTPAAPTASVSTQPTCVLATGTITVTVPTPAAGTSYTVTGTAPVVAAQSNATGVFTGLAAGNYTVTTTVGGCTSSTTSLTVNAQPATPAAPTASVTTQPTCVIPTGTITVAVPAPAAGTSYTVTGTAPVVAAQSNATGVFNGLAAGNYTVTTTVGGCTSTTTSLTINAAAGAPAAPTAIITQPTCGTATGIITVVTPVPAAGITYTLAGISPVVAAQTNATGIFINLASGDYAVIVTVAGCNSTPTSLTINAQPPTPSAPTASATQPTCVVATGTITVTVPAPAAGTTYTVTGTAPVVAAQTNSTGVFTGLAPGNYSVITTVGGCTSAATLLTINPQPANPTAPTASVTALPTCAVPTGTVTVTVPAPAAGTTYTLTGTSPVVAAQTNATGVFTGLTVGTYDVITTVGGCTSTASVIVISPPAGAPTISLTSSTDVTCFNDNDGTAVVSGSGGTGGLTYSWLPFGGSSASASGLTAGNYTVTVTDGVGCSSSLNVTIGGPAQIVITETVTDIICGSSIGQINTAVSGGDGTYNYAWAPNGEITSSITNLSAGNYSLTVTDGNGCSLTESYSVVATGSLAIVATPVSATIQQGESVQLNATGGTTYTWTPSNGLNFTDIADPIATPNTTTIYTVTATDASGCTGTDNVTIVIQIICGEVFVPTVFSPNGSGPGVNNTQCVYGTCIAELNYAIFNRWGEKVFETTDPLVCWDGTYKGKAMNSGVFAYKLVATLIDGTSIEESGNLTLIR